MRGHELYWPLWPFGDKSSLVKEAACAEPSSLSHLLVFSSMPPPFSPWKLKDTPTKQASFWQLPQPLLPWSCSHLCNSNSVFQDPQQYPWWFLNHTPSRPWEAQVLAVALGRFISLQLWSDQLVESLYNDAVDFLKIIYVLSFSC